MEALTVLMAAGLQNRLCRRVRTEAPAAGSAVPVLIRLAVGAALIGLALWGLAAAG